MKYAVIRFQGNQYKVTEGQEILTNAISESAINPEVLLLVNDEKVEFGDPIVKNAKLEVKIVEKNIKGEKIDVVKYKAKSRYRKKIGFRPQHSKLLVEKIIFK